ncbi:hypothetical protein pb186bvf_010744 [Paramecium bursaria]
MQNMAIIEIIQSYMNPYQVLGLTQDATLTQVKEAFRDLSKIFHPDKQPQNFYNLSVQIFEEIDNAYKMIGTQFNKFVYDHFGIKGINLVLKYPESFRNLPLDANIIRRKIIKLRTEETNSWSNEYLKSMEVYSQSHYLSGDMAFRDQYLQFGIQFPGWKGNVFQLIVKNAIKKNQNKQIEASEQLTLRIGRDINLPILKLSTLRIEKQFGSDQSMNIYIKKKFQMIRLHLGVHLYEGQLYPSLDIITSRQPQQKSIQFKIDNQPQIIFRQSLDSLTQVTNQISASSFSVTLNRAIVLNPNYNSSIQLVTDIRKKKIMYHIQSIGNFRLNSNLQLQFITSLQIQQSGNNFFRGGFISFSFFKGQRQKFTFPIVLLLGIEASCFIIALPQLIALTLNYIYKNARIKKEQKIIKKHVEDYQEYRKIIQDNSLNLLGDNLYKQNLICEQQKEISQCGGLIVLDAYIGLHQYILEYSKGNLEYSQHLIPAQFQFQYMVINGGLVIIANTLDQIPGFYRLDQKITYDKYSGYIKYSYNLKVSTQVWRYNETLEIGNVAKSDNGGLLNQLLIKYLFQ